MNTEVLDNKDDVFYFESDHVALHGNVEYFKILRTIAILEAQKSQLLKQIENLSCTKRMYIEQPQLLLQKLQNNEEIITSNFDIEIVTLPELQYFNDESRENTHNLENPAVDTEISVRGRVFNETKPQSFNRLWTCEEQRHLEELLVKYPVEEIEMRRFTKIAKELGNRTPLQVSSRVQKYFKKLHDAGMPIPGRIPKSRRGGHTKLKHLYRLSTFFPSLNVPVSMPDDEGVVDNLTKEIFVARNIQNIKTETSDTVNLKLKMLKIARAEKSKMCGYNPNPFLAKCQICTHAPISATRWYCNTCYVYLNNCCDCLINEILQNTFLHTTHNIVSHDP